MEQLRLAEMGRGNDGAVDDDGAPSYPGVFLICHNGYFFELFLLLCLVVLSHYLYDV